MKRELQRLTKLLAWMRANGVVQAGLSDGTHLVAADAPQETEGKVLYEGEDWESPEPEYDTVYDNPDLYPDGEVPTLKVRDDEDGD